MGLFQSYYRWTALELFSYIKLGGILSFPAILEQGLHYRRCSVHHCTRWVTSIESFTASGWGCGRLCFTRFLDYISLVSICCSNFAWAATDAATSLLSLPGSAQLFSFSFYCDRSYLGKQRTLGWQSDFFLQARAFEQSVL